MVNHIRTITFDEFASDLESFFNWVIAEDKPLLVEDESGNSVILRRIKTSESVEGKRRSRAKTNEDYEAF